MRKHIAMMAIALIVPGGLIAYAFLWLLSQCTHKQYSFPVRRKDGHDYVTCYSCARTYRYDWTNMKLEKELSPHAEPGVMDSTARTARVVEDNPTPCGLA